MCARSHYAGCGHADASRVNIGRRWCAGFTKLPDAGWHENIGRNIFTTEIMRIIPASSWRPLQLKGTASFLEHVGTLQFIDYHHRIKCCWPIATLSMVRALFVAEISALVVS
jgi:hypothetical protein